MDWSCCRCKRSIAHKRYVYLPLIFVKHNFNVWIHFYEFFSSLYFFTHPLDNCIIKHKRVLFHLFYICFNSKRTLFLKANLSIFKSILKMYQVSTTFSSIKCIFILLDNYLQDGFFSYILAHLYDLDRTIIRL